MVPTADVSLGFALVTNVLDAGTSTTGVDEVSGAGRDEEVSSGRDAPPGLATEVVRVPLSMYTPLKYQSSAPVPSFP